MPPLPNAIAAIALLYTGPNKLIHAYFGWKTINPALQHKSYLAKGYLLSLPSEVLT